MQRPLSSFRLLVGVLILLALVALVLQQFQGSSPVRPESEDVIGGSGSTAQPLCGPACAEPAEVVEAHIASTPAISRGK